MDTVLNTLYITSQDAYLSKDHGTVVVKIDGKKAGELPDIHIHSIVLFGRAMMSSGMRRWCCENGILTSYLTHYGRYIGKTVGRYSSNVLLRLDQYKKMHDPSFSTAMARNIVAGKVQNTRRSVLRSKRDAVSEEDAQLLEGVARELSKNLRLLKRSENVDSIRGIEGDSARRYFGVLSHMLTQQREDFSMSGRVRRPPTDPLNSVLSFLYVLLMHDCVSAVLTAGLDHQVGFLHAPRPGRDALALDLMEEFRPVLADRPAITMINRLQIQDKGFKERKGGACVMDDATRKTVIEAYQERKKAMVQHPLRENSIPLGMAPFVQAKLMARTIRGDIDEYLPFIHS